MAMGGLQGGRSSADQRYLVSTACHASLAPQFCRGFVIARAAARGCCPSRASTFVCEGARWPGREHEWTVVLRGQAICSDKPNQRAARCLEISTKESPICIRRYRIWRRRLPGRMDPPLAPYTRAIAERQSALSK